MTQRAKEATASLIKTWWGPLMAVILTIGAWFTHKAEAEHMKKMHFELSSGLEDHVGEGQIHADRNHDRLLIISETKGMRDALESIQRSQDVTLNKIKNIEEKVEEMKKSLNR